MTETNGPALVLTSGGLDSTTLVYWLITQSFEVHPLFLDYGQHCAETEQKALARALPGDLAAELKTINISAIYAQSSSRLIVEADLWTEQVTSADMYLPYRNLLFLSVAAAYAQSVGIGSVFSAFINSNHAVELDCSSEFFDRLSELLGDFGGVKIEMPFRTKTKLEVARLGLELGVPVGTTYSCQISSDTPCGACPNCVERLEALSILSGS